MMASLWDNFHGFSAVDVAAPDLPLAAVQLQDPLYGWFHNGGQLIHGDLLIPAMAPPPPHPLYEQQTPFLGIDGDSDHDFMAKEFLSFDNNLCYKENPCQDSSSRCYKRRRMLLFQGDHYQQEPKIMQQQNHPFDCCTSSDLFQYGPLWTYNLEHAMGRQYSATPSWLWDSASTSFGVFDDEMAASLSSERESLESSRNNSINTSSETSGAQGRSTSEAEFTPKTQEPSADPESSRATEDDDDVKQETEKTAAAAATAVEEKKRKRRAKLATPVAYPFAVVKPCGVEGDVTLSDINKRILMPPTRPIQHPVGEFARPPSSISVTGCGLSGKAVVALTRIHTQGKGTITIMRTKG